MTLTEEQREAIRAVSDLPRAIGCTRCHNYIQKNYSNQFAVLRSMIDNKDYVPNAAKLIELLAAGEHEQWADWAQSILDSEPGLSDGRKAAWPGMIATPYENLSEELKDKDRREVHLRSSVALDIVQQQAAEIERLRAELDNYGDDFVCQTKCKDARIKELESSLDEAEALIKKNAELMNSCLTRIAELEADLEQAERVIEARLDVIDQQAARIAELEKWLKKERSARLLENSPGVRIAYLKENEIDFDKFFDGKALEQLQAEGKIGPDATKSRSWQITEERKTMLSHCLEVVDYVATTKAYSDAIRDRDTIRAMLEENL